MSDRGDGPSNRTLDVETDSEEDEKKTLDVEEDVDNQSTGRTKVTLNQPSDPRTNEMFKSSIKKLTDANGVPLQTLQARKAKAYKLSANLKNSVGLQNKGNTSFMGLMSENFKNSLSTSKRTRIRKTLGKPGKLKRKQPSYENGSKFNLAQRLRGNQSGDTLVRNRLRKAGDIRLMLPQKPREQRIQSIQRKKFVPKGRAFQTVRQQRKAQNFASNSRMMNEFGDASHGTVEVEEDDEGNERTSSFVPKSDAIQKLREGRLKKLGESNSGVNLDETQMTLISELTKEDEESQNGDDRQPFVPKNSVIKNLQAKRNEEAINQKLSRAPEENQVTEQTLGFSDEETVVSEKSDPFLKSTKTAKTKPSTRLKTYISTRQLPKLSPQEAAAKESFRMSVAHFVNQTSDRRSVSFLNSHRSMLHGPSVRLSMAGANNAQDIVREIQERQRQQDEILSKLYRSRRFRQAERSRRVQNTTLSSNIRASMQVRVQPLINNEGVVSNEEHNRAKHYKKHGMLGFFSCAALGQGCDRAIDLTDLVPLDFKVVCTVTGIACVAAYVVFLFTADYSVDTLGLE